MNLTHLCCTICRLEVRERWERTTYFSR
uniref:Uncharacterized protein n=1 Tax=Anguilla anguilla TaxID=7936 RepID=A0A0E9SNS8_ANGAN